MEYRDFGKTGIKVSKLGFGAMRFPETEKDGKWHINEDEAIEDYKIVKKILDYLGIYEFERKRPPPRVDIARDEFDDYVRDDYIDCDHVC